MHGRIAALAVCALALAGCANHVRYVDEVRERETRVVTHAVVRIESRESVLAAPFAELALAADEDADVRRRETLVHLDEATPWRFANELWEVPTGLVCLPFFVGVRGSDKLFLGLIPDAWISDGTDFSLAALNPAMNVKSNTRLQRSELTRQMRDVERSESAVPRSLADTEVSLALGRGPRQSHKTDASGQLRVELLGLVEQAPTSAPRVLHVEVARDGARAPARLDLPLSRQLGARLLRAAQARDTARRTGVSADEVARSLIALDTLGFTESAAALEQELRERRRSDAAWLSRLDLALEDE